MLDFEEVYSDRSWYLIGVYFLEVWLDYFVYLDWADWR